MNTINVLIFPYGSDTPIVRIIENEPDSFRQILEGHFQDIPLPMNYLLMINDFADEGFKFQEKYNLYGNFIICKHNYRRPMSIEYKDIGYVTERAKDLIEGNHPQMFMPDLEAYAEHMKIEPQNSEFPILDEIELLINTVTEKESKLLLSSINDIAYYTRERYKYNTGKTEFKYTEDDLTILYNNALTGLNTINDTAKKYNFSKIFPGDYSNTFIADEHIVNLSKEYFTKNQ